MPTIARITTAAKTKTLSLSTSGLMVRALRDGMEIREKVQRAGDHDRPFGSRERPSAGQRRTRLGDRLDVVEVAARTGRELWGVECATARRGRGDEPAAERGKLVQ